MPIIHAKRCKEIPYAQISQATLDDPRLGMNELAILTSLIRRPSNWTLQTKELERRFNCGRDRVRAAIKNLIALGYIVYEQKRLPDGTYGEKEYIVHEIPITPKEISSYTRAENPSTVQPRSVNPPLSNKDLDLNDIDLEKKRFEEEDSPPPREAYVSPVVENQLKKAVADYPEYEEVVTEIAKTAAEEDRLTTVEEDTFLQCAREKKVSSSILHIVYEKLKTMLGRKERQGQDKQRTWDVIDSLTEAFERFSKAMNRGQITISPANWLVRAFDNEMMVLEQRRLAITG
ncbi:helix-turn-helix domain-containing protein [Paenibacillus xylanexedens]|uniref:helix-turn-helix domain-containing protein n=1 Tax=Paenibacillus xylanexedens TaxID=528191 RepID=UPI00119F1DDB|nr:helix-turn-helix domain-containing protein [Paenibacillus xylanexedens]